MNVKPLWTLKHWWSICRDYFCVVDSYALDLYWYKYERNVEYRFTRSYPNKSPRSLEFSDWIQLYSQKKINWEDIHHQEEWEYIGDELKQVKV